MMEVGSGMSNAVTVLKTSSELQEVALLAMLRSSDLLGVVVDDLELKYFSDPVYQVIYRNLKGYYQAYHKMPQMNELIASIQVNRNVTDPDLSEVEFQVDRLYRTSPGDIGFAKANLEKFIAQSKVETIITKVLDGTLKDTLEIGMDLQNAMDYTVLDNDLTFLSSADTYHKNRDLWLGSEGSSKVIQSFVPSVNASLTYKGYRVGELAVVVSPPGVGKTAWMINEAVNASRQGKNVLIFYIGDMNEVTASHRLMACATNSPINLFEDPSQYQHMLTNHPALSSLKLLDRIAIVSHPPGSVSANQLSVLVEKYQAKHDIHFDMILIDYADNLTMESDSLYSNGGMIYNKLKQLAEDNKSVVITGSQPKAGEFSNEIIPFEGIAESSKKLHVVDIAITMNKPHRSAPIASIFMAKVREGITGRVYRLELALAHSIMKEVTYDAYAEIKSKLELGDE